MFLFLMATVPLSLLLFFSVYRPWQAGRNFFLEDLLWGIRAFIPSLLIFWIVKYFLKISWNSEELFFYLLIKDYGLWGFLSVAGYGVLYGFGKKGFTEKTSEVLAYMMGFFILSGIIDTLIQFGHYDLYTLFILPLFRISLIIYTVFILGLSSRLNWKNQVLLLICALLLTMFGGLARLLFYTRMIILAWVLTGVFSSGSVICFLLILRRSER